MFLYQSKACLKFFSLQLAWNWNFKDEEQVLQLRFFDQFIFASVILRVAVITADDCVKIVKLQLKIA